MSYSLNYHSCHIFLVSSIHIHIHHDLLFSRSVYIKRLGRSPNTTYRYQSQSLISLWQENIISQIRPRSRPSLETDGGSKTDCKNSSSKTFYVHIYLCDFSSMWNKGFYNAACQIDGWKTFTHYKSFFFFFSSKCEISVLNIRLKNCPNFYGGNPRKS